MANNRCDPNAGQREERAALRLLVILVRAARLARGRKRRVTPGGVRQPERGPADAPIALVTLDVGPTREVP